jgi:hypothetical protein
MSADQGMPDLHATRMTLVVCAVGALFGGQLIASRTAFQKSGSVSEGVSLQTVEKVFISKTVNAYLVSYSYDFGPVDRVYIDGLGVVPAKGTYHHLVPGGELTFWDADKRTILKRVPLIETVTVAATPPMNEVPTTDEFPSSYRSFPWHAARSINERANMVLGKYFNYLPRDDNQITYLSTTYTPLPLSSDLTRKGIVAQVSLLLSFPHDVAGDKYMFRVRVLPKEGRTLSDQMRATASEHIVAAANKFVDDLVAELSR